MTNSPRATPVWSYARSGVDRSAVARALDALRSAIAVRPGPGHGRRVGPMGHYAGLVRLGREVVALTTDSVGTKTLLAERVGWFEPIGEDAVAVNANDVAAVGARMAGVVDVINCRRPDPAVFAAIGRGISRGLRRSGGHLLGGETAVVPDLVQGIDVGGTALGFFPAGRHPILGESIRPGDLVLGAASHGVHANGMTLVRRLVDEAGVDLASPRPGGGRRPVGRELLRPTRIYNPLVESIAGVPGVHGLAHISGGGVRNLVRLHAGVRFRLDGWPMPAGLFAWIQSLGNVSAAEMAETFNLGIGFVVVVDPRARARVVARARRAGFADLAEVGRVERGTGVHLPRLGITFEGYGEGAPRPEPGAAPA
ncbi:MAG: phosphoribosylformylglycinamidine cyclo-ligase [Thermoplasmata archaeon]